MQNIKIQKRNENRNYSATANQSTCNKELLWWKMRTAVWRRKYLDLKVKLIDSEKELARKRGANITFKACTGLLTRYIPELNVTALLATNRIASGAKICWRKVVNPVKVVGEQMGSGLYGLSRKVDGFWAVIKSKWSKGGNEQDRPITSKWRKFRRMFRMSNIVGSFVSRKGASKHGGKGEKPYCEKNPVSYANEFKERWSYDGKNQENEVSYPAPQAGKKRVIKTVENLDDGSGTKAEGSKRQVNDDEEFRPCLKKADKYRYYSELISNIEKRELKQGKEPGNIAHSNAESELEELRQKVEELEYRERKRDDLRKKRDILEKKMRHHSNKKRQEKRMLKKQELKLKRKMERLHKKFQKVFEKKVIELKSKKRFMQEELKKGIEMNKKEKKSLDKERLKFSGKVEEIQEKLRAAEEGLQRRRANFEKWSEEMRTKIVRENAQEFSKRYNEEQKLKLKHHKLVEKMKEKIERQKGKLEMKERAMNIKVEQLRSVLRRLLLEEQVKYDEMQKKDRELRSKENQIKMVKLFYADNLKREKEKHAEAKEMVWQMKQRVIKLKEIHDDILRKYKSIREKLSNEREKLKLEEEETEIYYPTVYCPDQASCKGKTVVKGYAYTKVSKGSSPTVFCPNKDSCNGKDGNEKASEFQTFLKMKNLDDSDSEVINEICSFISNCRYLSY